jgi:hypothetical protein
MGTKQFAARQGKPRRRKAPALPIQANPAALARGSNVPMLPRAQFSFPFPLPWFRERAEGLHRLFLRVEPLRKQGLSLNKALRRRWYGKRFHTAHHVKVRRSLPTLRAWYYRWRRNGRTPECLAVRFISTLPTVPPEIVQAFVSACAVAGVTHFSQAFRLTTTAGLSYRRVLAALPDRARQTIRDAFSARRLAEIERRNVERQLRGQLHRLLAADVARSRKLSKLAESFIGRRECGGSPDYLLEGKPLDSEHSTRASEILRGSGQMGFNGGVV